jgi:hypothetical protein
MRGIADLKGPRRDAGTADRISTHAPAEIAIARLQASVGRSPMRTPPGTSTPRVPSEIHADAAANAAAPPFTNREMSLERGVRMRLDSGAIVHTARIRARDPAAAL